MKTSSLRSRSHIHPTSLRAVALLALALAGPSLTYAASTEGSGQVKTENRQISGVNAVELRGSGDLDIVQGDSESLVISGDDNLLPLITTEVDGKGTLHIGFKKGQSISTNAPLKFNLVVKSLSALTLAGSGNIHAKPLDTKDFGVELAGSGNVTLDKLTAGGAVKVEIAGSGNVKLSGEATEQVVEIAGSGNYTAASLKSKTAQVSVSGSGDMEIWATDTLDAKVNGSGDVEYKGKPQVKKVVHGSGSVEPLSE